MFPDDGIDFFNFKTHPLCLPFEANEDPQFWNENPVEVLSYATQDFSGTKADSLESIDMFTFTQDDCNTKIEKALDKYQKCGEEMVSVG